MKKQLVIIGAGGHGRVAADIARKKYDNIIFLDDNKRVEYASGKISDYRQYLNNSVFFVAIGNNKTREKIFRELKKNNAKITSLISPHAILGTNVIVEEGVIVMHQAVINNGTVLKEGVIVNTYSSIDHDGYIGEFGHVAIGAHLAGTVKLGKRVFVGAGATIINNIKICNDVVVGAGAVVINDLLKKGTVVGTPARLVVK